MKQGLFILPLFFVSNHLFLTLGVKFVPVSKCGAVTLFLSIPAGCRKMALESCRANQNPIFTFKFVSENARQGMSCQFVQASACIPDPHLISGFLINHQCPPLLLYCPLIISVYLGDVVHYELRSNSFASPRLSRYDHALVLAV